MTDWNLSEKIWKIAPLGERPNDSILREDVKEFIRRLKNHLYGYGDHGYRAIIDDLIDNLAGEKLI